MLFLFCFACSSSQQLAVSSQQQLANELYYFKKYQLIQDPDFTAYTDKILTRLQKSIAYFPASPCLKKIQVSILKTPKLLALSPSHNQILLSHALANSLESEAELTFILAHEIAHTYYCHQPSRQSNIQQPLELQADLFAADILKLSGYNIKYAYSALNRLYFETAKNKDNIYTLNKSHPDLLARIQNLYKRYPLNIR